MPALLVRLMTLSAYWFASSSSAARKLLELTWNMARDRNHRKKRGEHFSMLPVPLIYHPAVSTLDHAAFRMLVLLAAQYRGKNNGAIAITAKQAAAAGIGSRHTHYAALKELTMRGLISVTFPSSRTPPRPTMYALTWLAIDDTDYSKAQKLPSHAYRSWSPKKQKRGCSGCTHGGAVSALKETASG